MINSIFLITGVSKWDFIKCIAFLPLVMLSSLAFCYPKFQPKNEHGLATLKLTNTVWDFLRFCKFIYHLSFPEISLSQLSLNSIIQGNCPDWTDFLFYRQRYFLNTFFLTCFLKLKIRFFFFLIAIFVELFPLDNLQLWYILLHSNILLN